MDGWRDMQDGNVELYYAIINILDWYCKNKSPYEDIDLVDVISFLGTMGGFDPRDIGDANNCGECKTWMDLIRGFKELWENGERE